ncbi:trimethylguanosine synthase isoform X2 [Anthonomus grandis grandis]|uniref:trimethylguanosine synthase isoform X2 n=1 Tax=Anthonomus grandis grandis TaxID=2921223 RepID=UPI0021650708|nr:trimethylguanosine synthase isoform X2 [Anthonomus grandis grandis]
MPSSARDVLALIKFNTTADNQEIHCLFSRIFLRNKPIKIEQITEATDTEEDQSIGKAHLESIDNQTDDNLILIKSKIKSNKSLGSSEETPPTLAAHHCSKYETDPENLSCYHSASHTDNISTDEHDSVRDIQESTHHFKELHISDSGTDLTELATNESEQKTDLETEWLKFWAINGEKLIWESWITKYSAYINPTYLTQESTTNQPGSSSSNSIEAPKGSHFPFDEKIIRKLSDPEPKQEFQPLTKILTRFLSTSDEKLSNEVSEGWNPLSPLSVEGVTEAERLLSSRCGSHTSSKSFRTIDSMTNVTRMTVSSLEIGSSQSSDSISSVSSVTSSASSEQIEEDHQGQWNELWKRHYEQEYTFWYNKFLCESTEQPSDVSNQQTEAVVVEGGDYLYRQDSEDLDLMANLGLPTKFGRTIEPDAGLREEENTERQQLRAALKLIGVEYIEEKSDDLLAEVEYKMKHIRHQNRKLTFHNKDKPKHIFFDEEGKVVETQMVKSEESWLEEDDDEDEEVWETSKEAVHKSNEESAGSNSGADLLEKVDAGSDIMIKTKTQKRKRKKKKIVYPPEMESNKKIRKYWPKRFSLFSKYDEGIKLDEESWYSVTPEIVAKHAADRCATDVIVDGFCGAGGNSIQFALTCKRVIAIDIDPKKLELARNNAAVYGVLDKIEFIQGDFFHLAESLKADAVFLSPPWGGISYGMEKVYDLETMLEPVSFSKLYEAACKISRNIAVFLPKNSNTTMILKMAGPGGKVEVEQDFINSKQIAITAYYGNLIKE